MIWRRHIGPGTLIEGKYRVEESIGAGGMGSVVLALDEQLERHVAIKFVHPHLLNADLYRRFVEEARAMARIKHPNVASIYSFGEHRKMPYFIMEYVPGGDLERWLKIHLPLSIEEATSLLSQVGEGLSAIHEVGAVHHDIKPPNILVGTGFRLVLTDFGLARLVNRTGVAASGGSPEFMAPELIHPRQLSPQTARAADIYALGVLAYVLFVGRLPFQAASVKRVLYQHLAEIPAPPSATRPEIPKKLDAAILRALSKEPMDRHATVEAFVRAVRESRSAPCERHFNIVIADDDPDFRRLATTLLRAALPGATIATAGDGATALDTIVQMNADLALVDLQMPELNGLELTSELRASDSRAKVVIITAVGGADDWKVLSSLGAAAFLAKPIDHNELVDTVLRLLGVL